jgi:eukaryotic-like serine/threonine-protein kinase
VSSSGTGTGTEGAGLAARLVEEMAAAWRAGSRPLAEEFLARHPSLGHSVEAVVQLVYEEICLREELGEEIDPAALRARFPQLLTVA